MRLAVLIADLLHLLVVLTCLLPVGGAVLCLGFPVPEPWVWMGLSLVPLVSTAAAAVVLDLQLIEYHPSLQQMRVMWSCLLMLFPPVVGPLLWLGWGRGWLQQQGLQPSKTLEGRNEGVPLPVRNPASAAATGGQRHGTPRNVPAMLLTTFEALGPVSPEVPGEEQTVRVVPRPRPVTATFYDERL